MFWGEILASGTLYNLYIGSSEKKFFLQVFTLQGVFKEQIKPVNWGITILLLHVEKGITPLDW